MRPKAIIEDWVRLFNEYKAGELAELYHIDAINDQVNNQPIRGRNNIRKMFEEEFAIAEMVCLIENIFEDGDWAILEWKDPKGLRGCGFFNVIDGKIKLQRGYWDRMSFLKQQGLELPKD